MPSSCIEVLMVAAIDSVGKPGQQEFHAAIASRSDRWYAACLRITRSPELAEDAVQEALLSAWNKRAQFNRSARLETWIHRIAVNAALQLLRKNKPGVFEPLQAEVVDESASPEAARQDHDVTRQLEAAMENLSDTERICFVLKHLEQWRLQEIADELEVNTGTVKQAVFRAVKKLRELLVELKGD